MRKTLALCLAIALAAAMAACGTDLQQEDGSQSQPELETVGGTVLDISADTLFLRTPAGEEYALDLQGGEIAEGIEVCAGDYVEIRYSGRLEGLGKTVRVVSVQPSETPEPERENTGSVAEGRVGRLKGQTATLELKSGTELSMILPAAGLTEQGQWLRLTFDGDPREPNNTVVSGVQQSVLTEETYHFSARVDRYDPAEDSLRFTTAGGQKYEVSLAASEVLLPEGGFKGGEEISVLYRWNGPEQKDAPREIAVLQVDALGLSAQPRIYTVVESYDEESTELVLHALDGRVLTTHLSLDFLKGERPRPGCGLWLSYNGWIEGTNLKTATFTDAQAADAGAEHESRLLGTVREKTEGVLVVEAEDGRMLRFTRTAAQDSIPEGIGPGDQVCVSFTGWLGGPEDPSDVGHAIVTHVARAWF